MNSPSLTFRSMNKNECYFHILWNALNICLVNSVLLTSLEDFVETAFVFDNCFDHLLDFLVGELSDWRRAFQVLADSGEEFEGQIGLFFCLTLDEGNLVDSSRGCVSVQIDLGVVAEV